MTPEKYLFNSHIFDEPDKPEEPEEPPPPTFSEEELETVRKQTWEEAYNKGKQDGLAESKASRDQMVAQVLQKIAQDTVDIFTAEDRRDQIFEEESLRLTLAVIQKLFPFYNDQYGFDELKGTLNTVLDNQNGQSNITIEVPENTVEGIQEHLATLSTQNQAHERLNVVPNDTLQSDECKLHWEDGGAIRNLNAITEEIYQILQGHLSPTPSIETAEHDSLEGDNADNDVAATKQASELQDTEAENTEAVAASTNESDTIEKLEKDNE